MNDVMHASVSLRYADVVVLDKAWADIAGRLKLPDTRIFRCTKAGLADALSSIRTIDISNCKVTAPPCGVTLPAKSPGFVPLERSGSRTRTA